jgi:hypothetical protein
MCFCAAKRITDDIKASPTISKHHRRYQSITDDIKASPTISKHHRRYQSITDDIKNDALPSGTTHPTADLHDCLLGNP